MRGHADARACDLAAAHTPVVLPQSVLTDGDWAVVELRSHATALNGMRFDNRYCWVVRFEAGVIVEVRAYLDSALVQKLIDGNETPPGA